MAHDSTLCGKWPVQIRLHVNNFIIPSITAVNTTAISADNLLFVDSKIGHEDITGH